jgi:N utilization substance protein B
VRRSDQRRDAVFASYQRQVTGRALEELLPDAKPFTVELAQGVEDHSAELDETLARHLTNWDLDRVAPLERAIMRVALYEIRYREDVPTEVALDEAVGLAKEFCGERAPGFVNGVLAAVVRESESGVA